MGTSQDIDIRNLISRAAGQAGDISDLTTALTALTDALAAKGLQPGDLKASAKSAPDAGWLVCDGSSVLRATYPDLFAAIGTTYGSVDGTHFTLPDLRGRVPMGAGTPASGNGATNHALGSSGGEETHFLTGPESGVNGNGVTGNDTPDHSHTLASSTQAFSTTIIGLTLGSTNLTMVSAPATTVTNGASARHAHPLTARNADSAHNNLQPFQVVNWWIKT